MIHTTEVKGRWCAYFEWQKSDSWYFVNIDFIQLANDLNFCNNG